MPRRPEERLPGDPAPPEREFGPLGGLVDDVAFWLRRRERNHEQVEQRLVTLAATPGRRRWFDRIRARLGRRAG